MTVEQCTLEIDPWGSLTLLPKVPAVMVPAFAIPPEAVKAPVRVDVPAIAKVPEPVVAIFPVVLIAISFASFPPVIASSAISAVLIVSENVVGGLRIAMFSLV